MQNQSSDEKWNRGLDLMIELIYTNYNDSKIKARQIDCEKEFNNIQKLLVDYLNKIR